ncbi:3D-(3,5/4)-trihydroxycyclohexane-1,2-dione acylhydrolase (decyclizing) [Aidingimonas halophila]|uniref:3D-(3,5/4)-trihydroxycyclohexane-1,2-dione hydrolase n=1 Tax=Aidingimonas halophila TaxID=574349 RepID=A0A1H2ZF88_9GAMM|nr:3D-(3,5/4)-trihydroxycyclohexane-1,2-dione acylhydrolase (decyclizing) [Aidingimonas halophila]GHC15813.1 3D-(3,5/4)-trihydroxycyclohexane-1,2-dione acylhydrolase (decyclizing) [Aidingimonas halophila]SDX15399.1 3D-(3,5/4)-trihydroxycyclohexane-1,2-dione hydrolase [Aidingimonas halophila]
MSTIRLTMAQALVKYLAAQRIVIDGQTYPLFEGVFAIFGHGNVAGMGEALYHARTDLPTLRAHNEQSMAHAAIAFAKANGRRRLMATTSSIGPGATNMVTAAALAHANRLPVLLLPGDTFATREPDPVLQQVEHFGDPTITVNDCFRPVSRYFDRITRPEQLLTSLPQAIATLLDPEHCGPVTLALPQDVQTFAHDYPERFFAPQVHCIRQPRPDDRELDDAIATLTKAKQPLIIAGGGAHYANTCERLGEFARERGIPVAETQAGKGALPDHHPSNVGAIGVTGSAAANQLAEQADVILAIGTRLQDFTTGSRALFERDDLALVSLNVGRIDSLKHRAVPLTCDAGVGLQLFAERLGEWHATEEWRERASAMKREWTAIVQHATHNDGSDLPTDAQVIGAVNRQAGDDGTVVCAAGGLPGELHKLWQCAGPGSYHVEYGYSCMGYEIAGGLGVKMARPEREVFVMVGDGSYLMHNSELATSVMLGHKLVVVVLDNRGFGCINRLQQATGGAGFNNLLADCRSVPEGAPKIDFAGHARALGCQAESVTGIAELEQALQRARSAETTYVIAIDTDPLPATDEGGAWWDVAVPEVSTRDQVQKAYTRYRDAKTRQYH